MNRKVSSPTTDISPHRGRKPGRQSGKLRLLSIKKTRQAVRDFKNAIERMKSGADPQGNMISLCIRNYAYLLGFHDSSFCMKAMSELRSLTRWANAQV